MVLNAGIWDRVIRVVIGLAVVSLAFFGPHTIYGFLGLIVLGTGLVGYCPTYDVIGIRTRRIDRD